MLPEACDTKAADKKRVDQRGKPLMAIDPTGGSPAMDYPEHIRTYSGFLRATTVMIVMVVAILLFLLWLVP
jgi:aa3 type cytochrome c oxidase subunit IV